MSKHCFTFLKEIDTELEELCQQMEASVFSEPVATVVKARIISEKLAMKICEIEDLSYLTQLSQFERLKVLAKKGIIEGEIQKAFDIVRVSGNRAAHDTLTGATEVALRVHRNIYMITTWYMETYGDDLSFKPEKYDGPIYKNEQDISEIVRGHLETLLGGMQLEQTLAEVTPMVEDTLKDYPFKMMEGSYLLNELSRLKDSAQEAVEGCESLSYFKSYLHIERIIQKELVDNLERVVQKSNAQLVMLCGSVGDGKSHLLAYVRSHYPELTEHFNVHNDATESFDPQKSSLETLAEVLKNFDDEHLEVSNEKLILAINLGVLNNFLDWEYAKVHFSKLRQMLEAADLFDSESLVKNFEAEHVSLISFSDYNLFELTAQGGKSTYISSLLEKVIAPSSNNPFYEAYRKDIAAQYLHPVIYNYKLLMIEEVREKVVQVIIQTIIECKKIISTRELLNFIYELIVPAEIGTFDQSKNVIEYMEQLLPNLLFNSSERSNLLAKIHLSDPTHIRHEYIDSLLIQLNISKQVVEVIEEYMDCTELVFLTKDLREIGSINELQGTTKQKLINTIIRFSYFFGKEIAEVYEKISYKDYLKYLYFFNMKKPREYKTLFEEVIKAVYKWQGSPQKDYIYLEDLKGNFKVSEKLELKPFVQRSKETVESLDNRFKMKIKLELSGNEKDGVAIYVDYPLYEAIVKLNKGYCPNKRDRENLIVFEEFIEALLAQGNRNQELLIQAVKEELSFKFEFDDDFGDECFKFERVTR